MRATFKVTFDSTADADELREQLEKMLAKKFGNPTVRYQGRRTASQPSFKAAPKKKAKK